MRYLLIVLCLTACASTPVSDEPRPACYAPWEVEPYKSGRAIPAPGPDAEIPICEIKP